jgi:ribosomal protein S26
MSQATDPNHHKAVKCLFCGIRTPLPKSRLNAEIRVSIVRCHRCGREAPYPEDKYIDTPGLPITGILRPRTA